MKVEGNKAVLKRLGIEAGRQINRFYHTRGYRRDYNPEGIDVFAEDWDNLLILDACRHDEFSRYDLPGKTESKISRGAGTPEWIRANFSERQLHDVVYVSSNAYYGLLHDEIKSEVHHFENLEEREVQDSHTGIETPATVANVAQEIADQFPNKRLLIHFGQPHYPYLSESSVGVMEPGLNLVDAATNADVSPEFVRDAYRETLDLAIDAVRSLLDNLGGKTVVSADHGEMLGDRGRPFPGRDYGHTPGIYIDELVCVPWHIHEDGTRRKITEEPPESDFETSGVEDRLAKLGYR